jgi:hypothetical protein
MMGLGTGSVLRIAIGELRLADGSLEGWKRDSMRNKPVSAQSKEEPADGDPSTQTASPKTKETGHTLAA